MRDPFAGIVPFVYTARDRSFRRAAERLGITPAAVSKAIQRLEEEIGVQLFHRTTRRVSLSPEGEIFLARCQEAMAQVHAGRELIAMAQRDPVGELTVSLPFILGRALVARLPRFLGRYPALELHLRLSDRLSRLVEEGVDVAIRMGELDDSSLVARRVMRTRWATVAAPAYLAQHGTPARPRDLAGHNCIKFRSPRGVEVEWSFAAGARGPADKIKTAGNLNLDQGEAPARSRGQRPGHLPGAGLHGRGPRARGQAGRDPARARGPGAGDPRAVLAGPALVTARARVHRLPGQQLAAPAA